MSEWTLGDPYEKARANGWQVVLPGPNELLIDIDNDEDYRHFVDKAYPMLQSFVPARLAKEKRSPGGNRHLYVEVDWPVPLDKMTRLLLQAAMGSDRTRELYGAVSVAQGYDYPETCFFETST